MNLNKFTEKAQEAVLESQRLAEEFGHPAIEPEHLLLSLLRQSEGVAPQLLQKLGQSPEQIAAIVERDLQGRPRVSGSNTQVGLSRAANDVLGAAENEARSMRDDFVSTEHILIALARSLAAFLFDDESAMVRIDMSEYQEKHTVSRLIGAPPGYVGYDEGGQLTEAIRRRPYSVVLFDEIEKAHAEVFNALLQLLDDGRLTDGHGRTVDFKNTLVIMTSNVGSQWIKELGGGDPAEMRRRVMAATEQSFKPEFLNRVDEIVIFNNLTRDDLARIVEIQLGSLRRLLADRKIDLQLSDRAKHWLADKGFDPVYGARPLKRTIQREVQDPLALKILSGVYGEGDVVSVDANEDGLYFASSAIISGGGPT